MKKHIKKKDASGLRNLRMAEVKERNGAKGLMSERHNLDIRPPKELENRFILGYN